MQGELAVAEAHGTETKEILKQLERLRAAEWMVPYYDKVTELSRRLTDWAVNSGIRLAKGRQLSGVSRLEHPHVSTAGEGSHSSSSSNKHHHQQQSVVVITGGGPGFMEAANYGASLVPGSVNIGVSNYLV